MKTLLYKLLPCLAVFTMGGCSEPVKQDVVIVQVADPQMGFMSGNNGNDYEIGNLSEAIRGINALLPDAVVFTGDMVHDPHDEGQWKDFEDTICAIDERIQLFFIPGNHDVVINEGFADAGPFIEKFGGDRFSVKIGHVLMTGINSTLLKEHSAEEHSEAEQAGWLESVLSANEPDGISLVFSHHPFFLGSINDEDGYPVISPHKRRSYFNMFKQNGVSAVFAGHLHNNALSSYDGVAMVTCSAVGRQLGDALPGVNIIVADGSGLSCAYYKLGEIPAERENLNNEKIIKL